MTCWMKIKCKNKCYQVTDEKKLIEINMNDHGWFIDGVEICTYKKCRSQTVVYMIEEN